MNISTPQDYEAVTLVRAGACLWIPKWISDIDPPAPFRIADEVVALFSLGLMAPSGTDRQ